MSEGVIKRPWATPAVQSGTVASEVSGSAQFSIEGKIVAFAATIATSSEIPARTALCSGLPPSGSNNMIVFANNNNVANSTIRCLITNDGRLLTDAVVPSGASLRIGGAYLSL